MLRPAALLMLASLALSGCGRDSGLNPFRWFGGGASRPTGPATLEPKGGYTLNDGRLPLARILSARWEPLNEGRLLVVTALPATRGWSDVAIVTADPQVPGRIRPDEDGVLNLVVLGNPPPANTAEARSGASPQSDTLTLALPLSTAQLSRIARVVVSADGNSVSLKN